MLEMKGTLSCYHGDFRFCGTDENGNTWYGGATPEDSTKRQLSQLFSMIKSSKDESLVVKITITITPQECATSDVAHKDVAVPRYAAFLKKIGSTEEPLRANFNVTEVTSDPDGLAIEEAQEIVGRATYGCSHAGYELVKILRIISEKTVQIFPHEDHV